MWMGRITKLTFTLLLVVALGTSLTIGSAGDGRLFVPTAQATLTAGPGPNDCNHCGGCASPCPVQTVCGHPCVPLGLLAANAQSAIHHADRLIPEPSGHLSSVSLRTPTPPPRS